MSHRTKALLCFVFGLVLGLVFLLVLSWLAAGASATLVDHRQFFGLLCGGGAVALLNWLFK